MSKEKVFIYDTTLRDGEQGANISFSLNDKLQIARKLDELGVDYIEGGWPNPTNIKALQFFKQAKNITFKNAKIAAFGSTRMAKNQVKNDPILASLLDAQTPVVTIFGKTWDLHVTKVLHTTLEENLKMIRETIEFLKENNKEVIFDAEHFFDGFNNNSEYALRCLEAAENAGVDWIVLADTNGGTLLNRFTEICKIVKRNFQTPLGIHAHNDIETAVANSILAVENGFTQVQGTMNGFGERCGNANLTSIIPILSLKMNYQTIPENSLKQLKDISHLIYETINVPPRDNQAFVGPNAFAHKGGIHANAIIKEPSSYEHIDPDLVGNQRNILVSEQAGASSLIFKAKELGFELDRNSAFTKKLLHKIKFLENEGYEFDRADASLKLFLLKNIYQHRPFFTLEGSRIIIEKKENSLHTEATIKIKVNNKCEHTAAEGNGPVNALDNALRKALTKFYPEVEDIHLIDYKVRVSEGSSGTSAKVKVFIKTSDHKEVWNTIGVSENIIEASWLALVDSIEYKLLKENNDLSKQQLQAQKM